VSHVGSFDGRIDAVASLIGAVPKRFLHKVLRGGPQHEYWMVFFRLSTGSYGTLSEYAKGRIDIDLQIVREVFAYEEDYDEVLFFLGINPDHVDKAEGNWTWLGNRQAKKVRRKDPPLPEDWWNHVHVVPSKRPSQHTKSRGA
jgi:hypothetical protein